MTRDELEIRLLNQEHDREIAKDRALTWILGIAVYGTLGWLLFQGF